MHIFASLLNEKRPRFLLAPLASLSHRGLREMIQAYGGCDLYFSEMISADALVSGSSYASYYLDAGPDPSRVIYQLVGSESATIGQAVSLALAQQGSCAGIDLNMGCSAPELVKQGAGVHWMSQPAAARQLVADIRPLVPGNKSLSAKIRIGESEDFEHLRSFCLGLQAEGIDFITLHPRLRKDPWSRPARWNWFRHLADELTIPLVANGDIKDSGSLKVLGETWRSAESTNHPAASEWPAGIMIGRAAVRQPWIFRHFAGLTTAEASAGSQMQALPEQIDLLMVAEDFHAKLEQWQPQDFWLTRAKRFHAFFGQNLVYGHRVSAQIQCLAQYPAILPFFRNYLETNPAERYLKPR